MEPMEHLQKEISKESIYLEIREEDMETRNIGKYRKTYLGKMNEEQRNQRKPELKKH